MPPFALAQGEDGEAPPTVVLGHSYLSKISVGRYCFCLQHDLEWFTYGKGIKNQWHSQKSPWLSIKTIGGCSEELGLLSEGKRSNGQSAERVWKETASEASERFYHWHYIQHYQCPLNGKFLRVIRTGMFTQPVYLMDR